MNYKPLGTRIFVREIQDVEEKTAGGVILLAGVGEPVGSLGRAEVCAVNDHFKGDYRVGDTIGFSAYRGEPIKLDDEDYLILRESDVIAVFPKD
jgi:chaperonin GroES